MVGIIWGWGFCPAVLPVINFQAKPDRFLPCVLKTTLGCGVAIAGAHKLVILKDLHGFLGATKKFRFIFHIQDAIS